MAKRVEESRAALYPVPVVLVSSADTEGKPNILRELGKALRRGPQSWQRGLDLPEQPSDSWHHGTWKWHDDAMPKTKLLEWDEPMAFNCNRIQWESALRHATDYALEYWDGDAWKGLWSYAKPIDFSMIPEEMKVTGNRHGSFTEFFHRGGYVGSLEGKKYFPSVRLVYFVLSKTWLLKTPGSIK